jgi:hypothetical protein
MFLLAEFILSTHIVILIEVFWSVVASGITLFGHYLLATGHFTSLALRESKRPKRLKWQYQESNGTLSENTFLEVGLGTKHSAQ